MMHDSAEPITILVTGAGAPGIAGTLFCLRNNCGRTPVRIVSTDIKPDPVGRYLADSFCQLPPPEDHGYLAALIEVCRR
jgi:carbamoyl-phosphate synthase large subunit